MNLGLCIANLLRRYPAVEVPGIGVFRKTHVPAWYDEVQSAFLPPANHIELTDGHPDGFPITAYLQAQQQVDGSTASGILDAAVKEVMESISRNGQALLDGLGYLIPDGASIVFKPLKIDDFDWKPVRVRLPAVHEKAVVDETKGALIESGPPETEVSDEEYSGKSRALRWVIAAVLLMLLAAGGIWYYQPMLFDRAAITGFFGGEGAQHHQSADQKPPEANVPLVESATDSIVADTVQAKAPVIDSIPVDSTPDAKVATKKPSVTYEIIVGSFATMAQARKFVTEMKARGYDLQAIDSKMPGNRKKISWGSFATEEEAYRELARVQKNFEPGAWIAKVAHE